MDTTIIIVESRGDVRTQAAPLHISWPPADFHKVNGRQKLIDGLSELLLGVWILELRESDWPDVWLAAAC